jgi:ankyrin repeat protein
LQDNNGIKPFALIAKRGNDRIRQSQENSLIFQQSISDGVLTRQALDSRGLNEKLSFTMDSFSNMEFCKPCDTKSDIDGGSVTSKYSKIQSLQSQTITRLLPQQPSSPGSISRPSGSLRMEQLANEMKNRLSNYSSDDDNDRYDEDEEDERSNFLLNDAVGLIIENSGGILKTKKQHGNIDTNKFFDSGATQNEDAFSSYSNNNMNNNEEFTNNFPENPDSIAECDEDDIDNWADDLSSNLSADSHYESHDTDNFIVEDLHGINDADSLRTALAFPSEVNAIKSIFKRVRKRIEEWKIDAVREEEHERIQPCWLGCGFEDTIEDIAIHLRDFCPNRMTECDSCHQLFNYSKLKKHRSKECPKRKVGCPNAWQGCIEILPFEVVDKHVRLTCKCRKMLCRLNCGQYTSYINRFDHEATHCIMRIIECDMCKMEVRSKEIGDHMHNVCPERMEKCRVGCGQSFQAKIMEHHETKVCSAPCKWGCGKIVGPIDRKKMHESMICPLRKYVCKHSCEMGGLTAELIEEHESFQCTHMLISCPNACGVRVRRMDAISHMDVWQGDCPERLVRCPSNLVGWRILVCSENLTGTVLQYKRTPHPHGTKNRCLADGVDQLYLRFDNKHQWIVLNSTKLLLIDKVPGENQLQKGQHKSEAFDCGWIPSSDLNIHLSFECINRSVWLKGKVDNEITVHGYQGQRAQFRSSISMAEKRDCLDKFQEAPPPLAKCEYCAYELKHSLMDNHKKFECGSIIVRCTVGCGMKLQRRLLDDHITNVCDKRVIMCNMCNNVDGDVWAEDYEEHISSICSHRIIICENNCDSTTLLAHEQEEHSKYHCGRRLMKCLCGLMIEVQEHAFHMLADCVEKPQLCPQGCGEYMPRSEVDRHVEKDCINQGHYFHQYVNCKLGCGTRVMRKDVIKHVSYDCVRRLTICPLKCGNSVQFDKLKSHLYFCPLRPVCCEPGMEPCEMAVHKWLYNQLEDDDGNDITIAESKPENDDDTYFSALDAGESAAYNQTYAVNSSIASRSSVYVNEGQWFLKDDLRLATCRLHGRTLLMASISFNEFSLTEYIIKSTKGKDLDIQSESGDTALIVACKLNKLAFVELILHSGADANIETTAGRTALISAVQSLNVTIVQELVNSGVDVKYKTKKHSRTAMDWARVLNQGEICRVLELGTVVQSQVGKCFNAITSGDMVYLNETIGEGAFFDANNEYYHYIAMEKEIAAGLEAQKNVKACRKKASKLVDQTDVARIENETLKNDCILADKQQKDVLDESDNLKKKISGLFSNYELVSNALGRGDLEEISRMKTPDEPTRISLFTYGLLLSMLDPLEYKTNAYSVEGVRQWWPVVGKSLSDSNEALKRLKSYSLSRLQTDYAKPMLDRFRVLLRILLKSIQNQERETFVQAEGEENVGHIGKPKIKVFGRGAGVIFTNKESPPDSIVEEQEEEEDEDEEEWQLPDTAQLEKEWDSDGEEAGGGDWVKGKWVPVVTTKIRWWERGTKKKKKKKDEISDNISALTDNQSLSQMEDMDDGNVIEFSNQCSLPPVFMEDKTDEVWEPLGIPEEVIETYNIGPFVKCILTLLYSADVLAVEKSRIAAMADYVNNTGVWQFEINAKSKSKNSYVTRLKFLLRECEDEMISSMKKVKFCLGKAKGYREKLRVVRILNHVTLNGHTCISWAASCGNFPALDEILTHGGTVGYPAPFVHKCATFLQQSYKIYKAVTSNAETSKAKAAVDAALGSFNIVESSPDPDDSGEASTSANVAFLERLIKMKQVREHLLKNIVYQRCRMRFPVPEAAYMGKWEIIERIYDRRLLNWNFSGQWVFPIAPPPFIYKKHHHHRNKKLDMLTILTHGISDLAAGEPIPGVGWVDPLDGRDCYGEAHKRINEIHTEMITKQKAYQNERMRRRLIIIEGKKQVIGDKEMVKAIYSRDFYRCIYLAQYMSSSIDMETEEFYTPLIAAAEENVGASNHAWMKNDDGQNCLGVEFLLDRTVYRPGINVEAANGHTPLTKACSMNRFHVAQALLDRKADIDRINRFGKTALHYAAEVGSTQCTRMLLERNCKIDFKDKDGRTAYNIADEMGFIQVLKLISRFGGGNMGDLKPSRGNVDDTITCPNGCGLVIYPYEVVYHDPICELREVECPLKCGTRRIMAKELDEHIADECQKRIIRCENCGIGHTFDTTDLHKNTECSHRQYICPLGCGGMVTHMYLASHSSICTWKIIDCPQNCGLKLPVCKSYKHTRHECEFRRLSCPQKCAGLILAKNLPKHMASICPERIVLCQFCDLKSTFKNNTIHLKKCDVRLVPCYNKCGMDIVFNEMKGHLEEYCEMRFVECPLKCDLKVRKCDLDSHMENICGNRLIECTLRCVENDEVPIYEQVIVKIIAKQSDLHLRYNCPNRTMSCARCSLKVMAKNEEKHRIIECLQRLVNCRLPGCLKSLAIEDRDDHERRSCRFRIGVCPQGCGESVVVIRLGKHMNTTCDMRYVDCPLKCGLTHVRQKYMRNHIDNECLRRVFPTKGLNGKPKTPKTISRSASPLANTNRPISPLGMSRSNSPSQISRAN